MGGWTCTYAHRFGWSTGKRSLITCSTPTSTYVHPVRSGPSPRQHGQLLELHCCPHRGHSFIFICRAPFADNLPCQPCYCTDLALSALAICALFILVSHGAFACQLISDDARRQHAANSRHIPWPSRVPGNVWRTSLSNIHVRRVRFTTSKFATHFNPSTQV